MYPYSLLNKNIDIFPLFWEQIKRTYFLPMDDDSNWLKSLKESEIKNQKSFQRKIEEIMKKEEVDLIFSWYLENRKYMFNTLWFQQMILEWRFFHIWLDLSVKYNTSIYSPLDAIVYKTSYEKWIWNYGWYIILEHKIEWNKFYSMYGHLNPNNFWVEIWDFIKKWTKIWTIWDISENGWYFFHTHLQVITKLWKKEWFFNKWYCSENQLKDIFKYVPNPSFLFRF